MPMASTCNLVSFTVALDPLFLSLCSVGTIRSTLRNIFIVLMYVVLEVYLLRTEISMILARRKCVGPWYHNESRIISLS
jgi:hypothetical protein